MANEKVIRLFFDMDGVLAKYNFELPRFEMLYEQFYFLNRPPQKNIVLVVRMLIKMISRLARKGIRLEIYILSAVLKESEYALSEKHDWLDNFIPEVKCKYRIFTLCGEDKIAYVPHFNPKTDILIDDFGPNCKVWEEAGGTYIKVSVNEEDAKKERKKHRYVIHPDMPARALKKAILDVAFELTGIRC